MTESIVEKMAQTVAQMNALSGGGTQLAHGCRLFDVPKGWESQSIAADETVARCDTLLLLEDALQHEEIKVIFVPADAIMDASDIARVCERNATTKTIFREVTTI